MNLQIPRDYCIASQLSKRPVIRKCFTRVLSWFLLWLLFAASVSMVHAQQPVSPLADPVDLSRPALEKLRKRIETNNSLDPVIRGEILKLYDEALKAISEAERFSSQADSYQRAQASVPPLVESLERQLLAEPPIRETAVPDAATAADVEQLLQQASAELAARREAVRAVKQSSGQWNIRRTEISRRAAALDQQMFELDSSIESTREAVGEPLLKEASLASLTARRLATQEEIRALDEELANIILRRPLRILREQRAERRVGEAIQQINQLETVLRSKVDAEMEENLALLRRDTSSALEKYPNLRILTDEILGLADQLFGPAGVEKRAEPLTAMLNSMHEAQGKAARAMEVARSKYAALGNRAEIQRWVPVVPPDIPPRHALQEEIRLRALRLADAKATLVGLQDRRANQTDMDSELATLLASLKPADNETEEAERQSLCRRLLLTKTELLDRLLSKYTDYYAKLTELDEVSKDLLRELEEGYQFTLERIFWRRSVAGPLIPAAGDIIQAARWLFLNPDWLGSIARSFQGSFARLVMFVSGLILLVLLYRGRKRLKHRLRETGEQADKSDKPLLPLFESVILTILLAIPLPLAIAELGFFLITPNPALIAEKVGAALLRLSLLTFGLELIVQFFRAGGIAQTQFTLNGDRCQRIQNEVRFLMLLLIPSSLLFWSFGAKASDHVGDPIRIAHLESLGRIAFIVGISAVAVTSLRLCRWLIRQGKGLFIRFAGAVLAVLGSACLFSVVLSISGWHLSAFMLAVLILRSFFLILDVALIVAFVERLRQIRERRLRENELRKQSERAAESEEEPEDLFVADEIIDVEATNRQVGELIRLSAIIITVVGLYLIWSAQMPSLRFLERVQLLPTMQILQKEPAVPVDAETSITPSPSPIESEASPQSALISPMQAPDFSSQNRVAQTNPGYSLTLAGLLEAIGILLFLFVLAKYLPSLLDFTILNRFNIVSGDRKAITTIVSYVFVIIGLSAAAAKMGLRWSQIQWLAAAFSFGLGFGLQDIFANFFSGLVLLFERPMRVGDLCRFGEQVGTVEAIGLRSTKVRSLDRTIINVPNADFSKKELINYTKRDRMLLRTTIGLRYETTDDQLRYVLTKLRELLLSHPKIVEDQARVRFVGYGDFSLDVEIFSYCIAKDWPEFLGIQEDVFLRIMPIIEESGTGFAFPSQTTYLARDGGLDSERASAAESEVEAWRSENKLPFPDFSERQRRRFRDSLDYPPSGSPFTPQPSTRKKDSKIDDDPER